MAGVQADEGLRGLDERRIGLSSQVLMDMTAEMKTGEYSEGRELLTTLGGDLIVRLKL